MKNKNLCLSIALAFLFWPAYGALAQQANADGLVLRGQIRNIKQLPSKPTLVWLEVELDLEFLNTGSRPIIFIPPKAQDQPTHIALTVAKYDRFESYLWSEGARSSSDDSELQDKATTRVLSKATRPPALTRTLQPKAVWAMRASFWLKFDKRESSYSFPTQMPWPEIVKIKSPLWMKLNFELWPSRVVFVNPRLGARLQRRWKKFGILQTERIISAEPIEIKLYDLKLKDFNNDIPDNSLNRMRN